MFSINKLLYNDTMESDALLRKTLYFKQEPNPHNQV